MKECESGRRSFDDLLVALGEFGRYQRWVYFFLFMPTIFSAMHKLAWVFLGAQVDHRCLLPGENATTAEFELSAEQNASSAVWDEKGELDQCRFLDGETGNATYCDRGWVYDKSTFGSSAVMDWDLVCDDKSYRATAQSLFMVGVLLGSYIFGDVSDRYGRKPAFFSSVVIQSIFGLAAGFVPEYWSFVIVRLVVGITTSGVFLVPYCLAMEMVGPGKRMLAGTLCHYYYTVGFFIMAGIAYFLNYDWQLLQIVLTLPTVLFVSYWWLMPESTRWLINKGRHEEARAQIRKMAKVNRVEITDKQIDEVFAATQEENKDDVDKKVTGLHDLFVTPNLRKRALNLFFNWFVNSGTYYGLSLAASNLGGNPYFNFLLSAAVEIPAYIINMLLLNQPKFGRRNLLAGLLVLAGSALFATLAVPEGNVGIVIALSMLGKLAITASYGAVYVFTAELFPTEVRNVAIGGCSMSARIGGIVCPYINLLDSVWKPLPLIIYGTLAVAAGLLTLLLPETTGKKLPETLQEGENFGGKDREDQMNSFSTEMTQ